DRILLLRIGRRLPFDRIAAPQNEQRLWRRHLHLGDDGGESISRTVAFVRAIVAGDEERELRNACAISEGGRTGVELRQCGECGWEEGGHRALKACATARSRRRRACAG